MGSSSLLSFDLYLQGLSTRTQETYETLKHEKPPQ